MSEQNSGSKTEKPTPKKIRDARKKGDIAKSRDVTNTLLLLMGVGLFWQLGPVLGNRLQGFTALVLEQSPTALHDNLSGIINEATFLLISVVAAVVLPIVIFGILCEFLQTGAMFALEKVQPKLSNLDPVSGLKRMFSTDSFVELVKSIVKITIIVVIATVTAMHFLPEAMKLPHSKPETVGLLLRSQTVMLLSWAMIIFVSIALLDLAYQKYSHTKKMMMSFQDIKQEHKSTEGDPQVKGQRQRLAREWAQEGATRKAKEASVLVVNPTHVAIALKYNKETAPVPVVTARGTDDTAMAMRRAAQQAGVPVLRNITLARTLLAQTNNGDFIPRELFDIVAQVIIWADAVDKTLSGNFPDNKKQSMPTAPGEDLSLYDASIAPRDNKQ